MTDDIPPPAPIIKTTETATTPKDAKAQTKADKAYAKAQRPWYLKKRFIIPGMLVLLFVVFTALPGGEQDATETEPPAAADVEADDAAAQEEAAEEAAAEAEAAAAEEAAAEAEAAAAEEEAAAAAVAMGTRDNPLAIGETGMLPDWEVTVDEINLDADAILLDANLFNDDPEQGNYGLATITATYTGEGEATPWLSFDVTLAGANKLQYSSSDAFVVEPQPMIKQPDVETGGTITGQFAFDFPDDAIGDGTVLFIEELISFDDDNRVFWQVPIP